MKFLALSLFLSLSAMANEISEPARKVCAIVYNKADIQLSNKLHIPAGATISDLNRIPMSTGGDWDNRISRVSVAAGCTFLGFQYQNFNIHSETGEELEGFTFILNNDEPSGLKTRELGHADEKVSSLKCFCAR